MTPDRLRQIEELYHSARESSADPELRREVEFLLTRRDESLWEGIMTGRSRRGAH